MNKAKALVLTKPLRNVGNGKLKNKKLFSRSKLLKVLKDIWAIRYSGNYYVQNSNNDER